MKFNGGTNLLHRLTINICKAQVFFFPLFVLYRTQFLWDKWRNNGVIASISNIVAICRRKQPAGQSGHQQGGHQGDGRAGETVSENQDRRHGVRFSQSYRVLWPEWVPFINSKDHHATIWWSRFATRNRKHYQ